MRYRGNGSNQVNPSFGYTFLNVENILLMASRQAFIFVFKILFGFFLCAFVAGCPPPAILSNEGIPEVPFCLYSHVLLYEATSLRHTCVHRMAPLMIRQPVSLTFVYQGSNLFDFIIIDTSS